MRSVLAGAFAIAVAACSGSEPLSSAGDTMPVARRPVPASTTTGAATTSSSAHTTTISPPVLTWSDEFDGPAGAPPDPRSWGFEVGGHGWGNRQLEYNSEQAAVSDGAGNLVITARPLDEDSDLSCWYGACRFESARLTTQGRFAQRYGRFEARLRLPAGEATWPALWMLGDDRAEVGWPACGEIDILEHVGRDGGVLHGSAHGPGYSGRHSITGSIDVADWTAFHVYAVDWDERSIVWSVDGVEYHRFERDETHQWVFDHDFHLVLNLAVGGTLAGEAGHSDGEPHELVVDYVRVYAPR